VSGLDSSGSYEVVVTASQAGQVLTWNFNLPASLVTPNPWTGMFTVFGSWGFAVENALAIFIELVFISIGSWKDTEWFLGIAIALAGVFVFIGWQSVPWMGISAALMVVVFMYIHKGKQEIREI
jgi:hypothetical protein